MRNFLHAGLDSSGAWKEKAWERSREPGRMGWMQHYGFLLRGESYPPCFPDTSSSCTTGLLGGQQQKPCDKDPATAGGWLNKVFPGRLREDFDFWAMQCLSPALCLLGVPGIS